MTIVEQRPAASSPDGAWRAEPRGAATGPADRGHRGIDPRLSGEVLATIALTAFTVAVAVGFSRVFAGWQFLDEMIVMAVFGHGMGFLLRRIGTPGWIAVPVMTLALAWMVGVILYRDTYTLLLPTGDTLELVRAEIEVVRQQFRVAVAPVIYGGGWDVLAAIGLVLVVVLSDTFAFRAFARAEALVPGGVLFVFVAALGEDRNRIASTALLVATGIAATIALRAHHAPQRPAAVGRRLSPVRAVVPAAVMTALVVTATAGWVGPRLPGADAEPIYETRGGDGGSVTEVVSPLVDIRSRLTNRSNSELFVMSATFESYWRSSALARFDGTTWGLPERPLREADGSLSEVRTGATELRQQVRVVNLGGRFVPTAADPVAASPTDALRWNADSSTLLKADGDLVAGDVFEIVSASPRYEPSVLQNATSDDPGDPIYLELPSGFPSSVGELAREVTVGATTPYETALVLQNWFRSEFEYSLEVQAGHSTNVVEGFLRDRIGYCEQFAGTYAAMMRTLGIPARVAVGFTPGRDQGGGQYSVLGKNAHAWPEVWFDGLGWVPFEPTPGRGLPGAENYTNVPAQQDESGVDATGSEGTPATTIAGPDPSGTATTIVPPTATTLPEFDFPTDGQLATGGSDAQPDTTSGLPWRDLLLVVLVVAAIAAPGLLRRWNRRHGPTEPARVVTLLWRRALDAVGEVGVRPQPSATPSELAAITAERFPVAARPIASLAEAVTQVSYAPDAADRFLEPHAHGGNRLTECRQWARQIERAVNDSISPVARVRRYFTKVR